MTGVMVFGMRCKAMTIFHVLSYPLKKKHLSGFGAAALTLFERVSQKYMHPSLISGKLNGLLAEIDKQAQECFDRLIDEMKQFLDGILHIYGEGRTKVSWATCLGSWRKLKQGFPKREFRGTLTSGNFALLGSYPSWITVHSIISTNGKFYSRLSTHR